MKRGSNEETRELAFFMTSGQNDYKDGSFSEDYFFGMYHFGASRIASS